MYPQPGTGERGSPVPRVVTAPGPRPRPRSLRRGGRIVRLAAAQRPAEREGEVATRVAETGSDVRRAVQLTEPSGLCRCRRSDEEQKPGYGGRYQKCKLPHCSSLLLIHRPE